MLIRGNAKLYVGTNSSISLSGGFDGIWIQTNASLNLYANTAIANISGKGVISLGSGSQFHYWGMTNNIRLNYSANGAFFGTFYAPNADVFFSNGGSAVLDFSGSIVCKNLFLDGSSYRFHYDENLKRTAAFY